MFTNALRTQARLALVSSKARISVVSQSVSHFVPRQSTGTISRTLSTFQALRQGDYDGGGRYASEGTSFRKEIPPSPTLFVGNLPYSTEEGELREKFMEFGEIKSVRIGMTSDGRARGFGHVEFEKLEDAVGALQAIQEEPIYILDRNIRIDFAPPRVEPVSIPNSKLYIFDFEGDEGTLRSAFKEFESSIVDVHLMKNPQSGESLGAGFITFVSVDRATEALTTLNGTEAAYGLKLKMSYARPPKPRTMRDEGRGGGRGGRSPEYGHSGARRGYGGDWGGGARGSDYHPRGGSRGGDRGGRDYGGRY